MVGSFFKYNSLVLISIALGAHIPDMSSEVGFLDLLYLGIFIILSSAFDTHFYHGEKPSAGLVGEMACAVAHFRSLIHEFSLKFIILLDGEPVKCRYVVDRLLTEFAAATVVLAKAVEHEAGSKEGDITASELSAKLESILEASYPRVLSYYSRCLELSHSDFIWTGPGLQIVPRETAESLLQVTTMGEMLELPTRPIYPADTELPTCEIYPADTRNVDLPSTSTVNRKGEKRPVPGNIENSAAEPSKKRKLMC
jgi:hypothetical protein